MADETRALLRRLVASGEVDALQAERVWQEVSRGLAEARPSHMIELLRDRIGLVLMIIGLTHCFELYLLSRLRQRGAYRVYIFPPDLDEYRLDELLFQSPTIPIHLVHANAPPGMLSRPKPARSDTAAQPGPPGRTRR